MNFKIVVYLVSAGSIEGYVQRDGLPGQVGSLYHTLEHWIFHLLTTAKQSEEPALKAVMTNLEVFEQRIVNDWIYRPILKTIKERFAGSGNGSQWDDGKWRPPDRESILARRITHSTRFQRVDMERFHVNGSISSIWCKVPNAEKNMDKNH